MKNFKTKLFIIISILLIIVFAFALLLFINKNFVTKPHLKEVEDVINKKFYSKDITKDKLEELMDADMINDFIFIGKDSWLRSKPESKLIKSQNLTNYELQQDKYASTIEERVKNKTTYTVKELSDGNLEYKIKPWYFFTYSYDLAHLTLKILNMSTYDSNNQDEFDVAEYKARIIAMKILDKHLSSYDNSNEVQKFIFYYTDDEPDENQYFSLYLNLAGVTMDKAVDTEEEEEEHDKILNDYLNEAISSGIVNEKDPLSI